MVKKNKLIASIIIRGKNEAKWLKILLPILKKQTIQNFEIIFCDNKSIDNSLEILKKYKVKKIISFKNYLPGKVLNSAIKISSGQFICILSSHCIPASNKWLQEHLNYINKDKNYVAVFGKQIPLPGSSTQNLIDLDIIFKDQEIIYKKDPYLNNANSIYRSSVLKKNLFNSKLTNVEDREWANRIIKKGYTVCYSALSDVYHLHGIHQHQTQSNRSIDTHRIIQKKYIKKWKSCNFLYKENLKFGLIVNARREHNKKALENKIEKLFIKLKNNFNFIDRIILITNFNYLTSKKFIPIVCNSSLSNDLKYIYRKFKKFCINWNYIIYINIEKDLDKKLLLKLIDKTVYNCFLSSSYGKIVKENFLINSKTNETFKSFSLEKIENKPTVTLIKLSRGAIADIDYLRKGLLVDEKSHIECI